MDRVYVKHQNKVPVHYMGLYKWRDVVVRHKRIRERLLSILLDMVHRERCGEVIDRAVMRSTTQVHCLLVCLMVSKQRLRMLCAHTHVRRLSSQYRLHRQYQHAVMLTCSDGP